MKKFPPWIKKTATIDEKYTKQLRDLRAFRLNTVCEDANCPNICECFKEGAVTFLILGKVCTRGCRFCSVEKTMKALPPDPGEPKRIVKAILSLKIRYAVITSPTRDDLADGGASHFAAVSYETKKANPKIGVELLIPDFAGSAESVKIVEDSGPDVIAHNIETVPRLYKTVRQGADYKRSLEVLQNIRRARCKSGLMLGLGETKEEVIEVMKDLRGAGCKAITLGQYLKPTKTSLDVERFVTPEEFDELGDTARKLGFTSVMSGPFVRSSYLAEKTGRA